MSRFSRRKMALALACASVLGGKTQAMKEPQSRQIVAAVGGRLLKIQVRDLLIGLKTIN